MPRPGPRRPLKPGADPMGYTATGEPITMCYCAGCVKVRYDKAAQAMALTRWLKEHKPK